MADKTEESSISPDKGHFRKSETESAIEVGMKVSDFLRLADDDYYDTVRKSRRRKRSNLGAPSPQSQSQSFRSHLFQWLQNPKLAAGDGGDGAGNGTKLGCRISFPRSCCLEDEKVKEKEERDDVAAAMKDSLGGHEERKPEALSFKLGLGAALIFFLAKSATEFIKMTELRSEMEILLKYVKGEIQRNAVASMLAESKLDTLPTSNYWEILSSNKPLWLLDETESCNTSSNLHIYLDDRMCLKGNEMEQELQVELKSLQLNLVGQDLSVHPYQRRKEAGSQSCENLNGTHKVNRPKEAESNKHCGVCPRELERRLYELLEARKQEWIEELETDFKCRERKFHEKDTEICWWGETLQGWSQSIEKTSFICSSKRDAVESASSLRTCI
ncbi:hypothetical protein KFK09_015695 [Dendrobium nobile]|uniref:Uncharacterized protein n=1 Tax=Dendrobium nobile TaxID=94219 RepID=A0A8T3B6T7_DENNO|nr:hypothetical protein KFK09_015695 [Dendrobium nobile]